MILALNRSFVFNQLKSWHPGSKLFQSIFKGPTSATIKASSPYKTIMPDKSHISLSSKEIKEKVIIIGDVHGCLDELKDLLVACKHNPMTSTVIFVGDLVNKGPYSAETVHHVRHMCDQGEAYCIRGNHDDFIVGVSLKLYQPKLPIAYVQSLSQSDINWLNELPYTISIPSMDMVAVHAGLIPGIPLEQQRAGDMHSMRNIVEVDEDGVIKLIGSSDDKVGKPWVQYWQQSPYVYFGHDAKRGIQRTEFVTGLDTGCVYGRKLTAAILPSKEIVSVNARRVYEEIKEK